MMKIRTPINEMTAKATEIRFENLPWKLTSVLVELLIGHVTTIRLAKREKILLE